MIEHKRPRECNPIDAQVRYRPLKQEPVFFRGFLERERQGRFAKEGIRVLSSAILRERLDSSDLQGYKTQICEREDRMKRDQALPKEEIRFLRAQNEDLRRRQNGGLRAMLRAPVEKVAAGSSGAGAEPTKEEPPTS